MLRIVLIALSLISASYGEEVPALRGAMGDVDISQIQEDLINTHENVMKSSFAENIDSKKITLAERAPSPSIQRDTYLVSRKHANSDCTGPGMYFLETVKSQEMYFLKTCYLKSPDNPEI